MEEASATPSQRDSTGRRPLWWALVALTAVVAHLPALRGYFFQDDWPHLAQALGRSTALADAARPLSRIWGFRIGVTLFDLQSAAWHGAALLAWALACVLVVRLARRTGLGRVGATVAGLVAAATPTVLIPVFWASASAEIFAVLFALAALDAWLSARGGSTALAVGLGLLSFFTKEAALVALPVMLAVSGWTRTGAATKRAATEGPGSRAAPASSGTFPRRRGLAWGALGVLALGSLAAATLVLRAMGPHSPYDPYAMGGPRLWLMNLGALGAWLASPRGFALLRTPSLPWVGLAVWAAWLVFALWRWRHRERAALWWWGWSLLSLVPVLPLLRHLQPYYLLAAVVGWGWTLGRVVELLLPESHGGRERARRTIWTLAAAAIVLAAFAFLSTRQQLGARDERGLLRNPLARRSAIAYEVHRLVRSLPLQEGQTLAVLAATYTDWPRQIPAAQAQRINSQVYVAIEGAVGLSVMVPEGVKTRWDSHLDGLRGDALVLFDDGGPRLSFWGDLANARFYSALVAVAAGQFQRALHDLWVVGGGDARRSFIYDPDRLPIPPEHLDENAQPFLHYILEHEEDTTTATRLVMLFQQLYHSVRGRTLELKPLDTDG